MGLINYAINHHPDEYELKRTFHYDEVEDKIYLSAEQDIEAIVQNNINRKNSGDGFSDTRELVCVGSIPLVVIEKIINEQGWDPTKPENSERCLQLLADPEYSMFATTYGKFYHKVKRDYFRGSTSSKVTTKPVYFGDE